MAILLGQRSLRATIPIPVWSGGKRKAMVSLQIKSYRESPILLAEARLGTIHWLLYRRPKRIRRMKNLSIIKWLMTKFNIKNIKVLLKSKWVIFGVGPVLTLIGVGLVIWVGHLLTSHPAICLSCHARQSSISMWSPSEIHPARVTCVNCHAKVGQLFPRDFFADEEAITGGPESCTKCHTKIPVSSL